VPLRSSRNRPDPKDRIAAYEKYGRAIALASSGKLEEADRELVALIGEVPDASEVRISLGVNQQKLGRDAEAVENFRRVIERDPKNALAHFDLAVSLFKLQRLNEAAPEVHAALAISPWYARAQELEGNICLQRGDYTGARRAFERLLAVEPDDYTAHYNLGILSAKDRDWEQAAIQLRAASHIDPNAADAYSALGGVGLQRGDLSGAADALRKAIRLRPKFASAHYNLGLVLVKQQKRAEAANEFREALEADPQFTPARTALDRLTRSPE
jgi:Tfp pilus assembly protein PilF